jgi:hypothetical protein
MSRPVYETSSDLEREDDVRAKIMLWAKCSALKCRALSVVDSILHREGHAVALAEIKCRSNTMDMYATYMLSQSKFEALKRLSSDLKLPVYLFVRWSCGRIGRLDLTGVDPIKIEEGGRTDRNDPKDVEPVAHWDLKEFKLLP